MSVQRLLFILPVMLFAVIGIGLAIGLTRDPSILPSALTHKPVPEFALPPLDGRDNHGLTTKDLTSGEVSVVNVFASWCVPCRAEHPLITRLAESVPVHGLNYKDDPGDAMAWLAELGDPYTLIGSDKDGRAGIEWGVYGVPETFIIDSNGRIAYKQVGPLTPKILNEKILPLVEGLRQ